MEGSHWRDMVVACRASGMTAKAWCEEHGINYRFYCSSATKYNREEREKDFQGHQWAELKPISDSMVQEDIKLTCGKWTLCVSKGVDPDLFLQVLMAVNDIC